MFIFLGILLWIIIGFCTYLWNAKITYTTCFSWYDFLFTIGLGLISFIVFVIYTFVHNFPKFMENLMKKINK